MLFRLCSTYKTNLRQVGGAFCDLAMIYAVAERLNAERRNEREKAPGTQVTEKGRDHGNCDSKGRPFGSQVCGRGPCSVTSNQRSDWERSYQRSDHELTRLEALRP